MVNDLLLLNFGMDPFFPCLMKMSTFEAEITQNFVGTHINHMLVTWKIAAQCKKDMHQY